MIKIKMKVIHMIMIMLLRKSLGSPQVGRGRKLTIGFVREAANRLLII